MTRLGLEGGVNYKVNSKIKKKKKGTCRILEVSKICLIVVMCIQ